MTWKIFPIMKLGGGGLMGLEKFGPAYAWCQRVSRLSEE